MQVMLESFDVGREQLSEFLGRDAIVPDLFEEAFDVRGRWVLVYRSEYMKRSRCVIARSQRALRGTSVEVVECGYDAELWHVVDDEKLWSVWERRVENSKTWRGVDVCKVQFDGDSMDHDFFVHVPTYRDAQDMLRGMGYEFGYIRRNGLYGGSLKSYEEIWQRPYLRSHSVVGCVGIDLMDYDYMSIENAFDDEKPFWL